MIGFTCLFSVDDVRGKVVDQLSAISNPTEPTKSRFSVALEVKCKTAFLVMYAADLHVFST